MWTRRSFRTASVALLVTLSACAGSPTAEDVSDDPATAGVVPIEPGGKVALGVGETAEYAADALKVTYVRLVADSRCPTGAVCVWEGDAEVLLRIVHGRSMAFEESLHTDSRTGPGELAVGPYVLSLVAVEPYPSLDHRADPARSRVELGLARAR